MAGQPALRVEGLARLQRTLKRAGEDVSELKELNRAAAAIVAPVARSTAPVRSGRMAASVRTGATMRAGIVRVGSKGVPYAGPIHYGWPSRKIKPQPFLTDAAKATESRWFAVYRAGIEKIISRIEGK